MMQASVGHRAAKDQAIRIARGMTASTNVTPAEFLKLCRTILRDSRNDDFVDVYGEPPAFTRLIE